MKVITDPEKIENVLTRGVEKIYPGKEELRKVLSSGKRLRLYCGYDPTAPFLHLGHLITLKKLAQFQKLGHEVIMLIGDFTGMIGDPTEKLSTRKRLSRETVILNAKNYKKLARKVLDFENKNPAKILFNSAWLKKLDFEDLINLSVNFTVQQMIIRDFFQERIKRKKPIFLHEFLYPLAQAYDSVAMDVDLEIGGKDQTFNMLCGRDLIKVLKNKEKFVMALKLLVDPTGKKMGKTEGNLISMEEKPEEMYGKIMAWPDTLIGLGFELLTDIPMKEVKETSEKIKSGEINPREVKARLAREIVATCHNQEAAKRAEREFERVFKEKKLPTKIPKIKIKEKTLNILDLLVKTKLASSKSEAKRLILQKGVKIDGKIETDWQKGIEIKKDQVIQVGKRKFIKITN